MCVGWCVRAAAGPVAGKKSSLFMPLGDGPALPRFPTPGSNVDQALWRRFVGAAVSVRIWKDKREDMREENRSARPERAGDALFSFKKQ